MQVPSEATRFANEQGFCTEPAGDHDVPNEGPPTGRERFEGESDVAGPSGSRRLWRALRKNNMRRVGHSIVRGLTVVFVLPGGSFGCTSGPDEGPPPRPPRQALTQQLDIESVILISIDTLLADHLACYGHPFVRSSHADALAAEGLRFTQHINAAPTTLASHTSLMTGTYRHTHVVPKNGYVVHADDVMLAEVLGGGGLTASAFIGSYPLDAEFGFDQGFDAYDCTNSADAGGRSTWSGGAGRCSSRAALIEVS